MNQDQITHFINRMVSDNRLKPVHISLSIALFHSWMSSQFELTYRISRSALMKASRIRSRATYHKTLKELQTYGYLRYLPSYHPKKASEVMLLNEITSDSHAEE